MRAIRQIVVLLLTLVIVYNLILPQTYFAVFNTHFSLQEFLYPRSGPAYVDGWRLLNVLYAVTLLAAAVVVQRFVLKRGLRDLRLLEFPTPWKTIKWITVTVLGDLVLSISAISGVILISTLLGYRISLRFEYVGWLSAIELQGQWDWILVLAILAFTIVGEEVFFRGFLLGNFMRLKGPSISVILTAILFGLCQFSGVGITGWYVVVAATMQGLVHGTVYRKTESLFPLIVGGLGYFLIWFLITG